MLVTVENTQEVRRVVVGQMPITLIGGLRRRKHWAKLCALAVARRNCARNL